MKRVLICSWMIALHGAILTALPCSAVAGFRAPSFSDQQLSSKAIYSFKNEIKKESNSFALSFNRNQKEIVQINIGFKPEFFDLKHNGYFKTAQTMVEVLRKHFRQNNLENINLEVDKLYVSNVEVLLNVEVASKDFEKTKKALIENIRNWPETLFAGELTLYKIE